MGSCGDLIRFVDGELDEDLCDPFRAHLATCGTCQTGLIEAMQWSARLDSLGASATDAADARAEPPADGAAGDEPSERSTMHDIIHAARCDIAERAPAAVTDPDRDVLALVDARDLRGALESLMIRYGTAVYRYCRVSLRDPALADDVHQHVFIAAFRDLPRFARRSTLKVWLFAIARHRVLDAAKRRKRTPPQVDEALAADVCDPRPLASESIDDARLNAALAASVAELPEPARTAVLLRYQQGFTFEAMAAICGEQAGTLSARVARALPVLQAAIAARLRPEAPGTPGAPGTPRTPGARVA